MIWRRLQGGQVGEGALDKKPHLQALAPPHEAAGIRIRHFSLAGQMFMSRMLFFFHLLLSGKGYDMVSRYSFSPLKFA